MHRREFLRNLGAAALLLHGTTASAAADELDETSTDPQGDGGVRDQLPQAGSPDRHHATDIFLEAAQWPVLQRLQQRLGRVQQVVGHGNFALLGVDAMRRYARNFSQIGELAPDELALLEQLFYADASGYGFYGEKPLHSLTAAIDGRALLRQPGSSQYLFKGEAQRLYLQIQQALGAELVLTSGVRGVVKQMHLFLTKAAAFDGNLSLASRSLAPPGYSFHGVGDFDVGKRGWGARNFSAEFADTEEFRRLQELGFVTMRYPQDNRLGVRYEPWHIKVRGV
ncbi:MAG: M15 family metallopeptidase [Gammaproteobacteria bacterium]|nr:M15 family metallopeptidase [Gammaproteobacteria bacterium]